MGGGSVEDGPLSGLSPGAIPPVPPLPLVPPVSGTLASGWGTPPCPPPPPEVPPVPPLPSPPPAPATSLSSPAVRGFTDSAAWQLAQRVTASSVAVVAL